MYLNCVERESPGAFRSSLPIVNFRGQMILVHTIPRYFLCPWDRASLMYSSKTNKMQSYTKVFITINDLHVSGASSAHHKELKTAYTALGICRAFTAAYRLLTQAVRSSKSSTNTQSCVCSFELLMMGGGSA